jgi:hypothetical protein
VYLVNKRRFLNRSIQTYEDEGKEKENAQIKELMNIEKKRSNIKKTSKREDTKMPFQGYRKRKRFENDEDQISQEVIQINETREVVGENLRVESDIEIQKKEDESILVHDSGETKYYNGYYV